MNSIGDESTRRELMQRLRDIYGSGISGGAGTKTGVVSNTWNMYLTKYKGLKKTDRPETYQQFKASLDIVDPVPETRLVPYFPPMMTQKKTRKRKPRQTMKNKIKPKDRPYGLTKSGLVRKKPCKYGVPKVTKPMECNRRVVAGKIMNPKTGRLVSRTGVIGKRIIKAQQALGAGTSGGSVLDYGGMYY